LTGRSAIPSATYRLQLHKDFTFADAKARVDYFAALGVSHLYLSPILAARAGSMHGYDVIDHRLINPELGGETGFRALAEAAQAAGLGLIVDIVPNHMAVGGADNPFWLDVLEHGRASAHARMFDIDFDAPGCDGKVAIPVLGDPYGEVLASGALGLAWDKDLDKLAVAYGPHRFPIRPEDWAEIAQGGDSASADLSRWRDPATLHVLLERQNFRLTWWRTAGDLINWRRFFDVNELAGLRVEDEAVFDQVHAVTLGLYGEGLIDGVRIDHVDGLADPAAYLQRLRDRLDDLTDRRPQGAPRDGPYVLIEKILGRDEALEPGWPVDGTTGYDFMNEVSALQHDARSEGELNWLWASLSGRTAEFSREESLARAEILSGAFAAQLAACAQAFAALAAQDLKTRDLGEETLRRALAAVINRLAVYRSYGTGAAHALEAAIRRALDQAAPADRPATDFIGQVLGGDHASEPMRAEAIRRLNQLTAPVAAKAVEDTAFYRYSRLLSRNDVGFDAGRLAMPITGFLQSGKVRAEAAPRAMLTTATHDHKRGEDMRARLAVISELPHDWRAAVDDLFAIAGDNRIAADDAYATFQTLVGAWPMTLAIDDRDGLAAFAERVVGWRVKALREAKLRSSWAAPDMDYEAANQNWLEGLLDPERSSAFIERLASFVARIAPAGAINGLTQAVLRCACPGVPDLYQGCELWDFSLVDPDNRRPVDYGLRADLLAQGSRDWTYGAVKQAMVARLLAFRRTDPLLFTEGAFVPLQTRGARREHVLAFERRLDGRRASVAVILRVASADASLGEMPDAPWWSDTEVEITGVWRPASALFDVEPVFVQVDD
jgi:(1->4)-alpha-D-glucan 1-alpha-D-glucosylmutase